MRRRRVMLLCWAAIGMLFFPSAAYAYIDPATTTYLIQIVTAIVITLGVTLSVLLYRVRLGALSLRLWAYKLRIRLFSGRGTENASAFPRQADARHACEKRGDAERGTDGGIGNASAVSRQAGAKAGDAERSTGNAQILECTNPAVSESAACLPAEPPDFRIDSHVIRISESAARAPAETGLKYAIPVRETFPAVVPPPTNGAESARTVDAFPAVVETSGTAESAESAEAPGTAKTAEIAPAVAGIGGGAATGRTLPAHAQSPPVSAPPASALGKWRYLWQDGRTYKKRLLPAALAFAAASVTFVLFAAVDLTTANADMLPFGLRDIAGLVALAALLGFAVPAALLPLLKGRLFDILLSVALAILTAGYLQGNFLNRGLGELTGDTVAWDDTAMAMIANFAVWAGCLLIVFALRFFAKRIWGKLTVLLPVALIAIQAVALVSMIPGGGQPAFSGGQPASGGTLTYAGMTEVSSEKNIIVFLLDRLDDDFISAIESEGAGFFNELDGFTHFTNNMTHYPQTFPSVAEIFTGDYYYYDLPGDDYFWRAYQNGTFLPDLKSEDFSVKLYMERGFTYSDIGQLRDFVDNVRETRPEVDTRQAFRQLLGLGAYRYAPHALKPFFWMAPDAFNGLYYYEDANDEPYRTDDVYFYGKLCAERLRISGSGNNFAYYHLLGAHPPFVYDENVQPVAQSTLLNQTRGSFRIVFEYIRQLKELGLYEDATIIIMGDHGWPHESGIQAMIEEPVVTGLFVKPSGSAGVPLAQSGVPVSTENFRAAVIEAAGGDPSAYGLPYFDVRADDETPRKYIKVSSPRSIAVYEVVGNAANLDNWRMEGEIEAPFSG